MNSELRQRVASAIILLAIAITVTWYGSWLFSVLMVIVGLLVFYEWSKITNSFAKLPSLTSLGWGLLILLYALMIADLKVYFFIGLLIGGLVLALLEVKAKSSVWIAGGIVYAAMPVIALSELRGETLFGLFVVLFIFIVVWATDIFAYFCGRALGGAKLAPKISPGKTWSGAIFGLAAGVGAGLYLVMTLRYGGGFFVPLVAVALSVVSQLGDLFESWIKRRFNVKDSGKIIPGHGGVMDRLDGIIFAAILAFVIALVDQYYAGVDSSHILAVHLLGL